ncbi:MAG TPA: glycerol-3-phosphate 1-O-acyltransferase PlsY [Bryobacteraceae bacterium]
MIGLLAAVIAYLLGSIPFGYIIVRSLTGSDIRASGSGNIGATNVLRTTGRAAGIVTLLLDCAKGYLAVWLASWLTGGNPCWTSLAAVAAILGHGYPVFLGFKGGKAVATTVGAFLFLTPAAIAAVTLVFVVAVALTRFISLGSILAAGLFPLAVWLIAHPPFEVIYASLFAGAFIVYRHRENIHRLREGNERVLSLKGRKS